VKASELGVYLAVNRFIVVRAEGMEVSLILLSTDHRRLATKLAGTHPNPRILSMI